METFLQLSNIPSFNFDLNNFLEWANIDLEEYLKKLPLTEAVKLKNVNETDLVKIYSILINQNRNVKLGKESPEELYNICIDVLDNLEQEENLNNCGVDLNYYRYDYLPIFNNVKNIIPNTTFSSWIFFAKKNFSKLNYSISDNLILAYFLMEDLKEGSFVFKIDNEERVLSKRGDYAIFNMSKVHSIISQEAEGKFFVTSFDPINLDYQKLP